jgi:chromosomal replication initiator protein
LDGFRVGPENALAIAAVDAVLDQPADKYNPLVFYGASGTGKTHLARGLEALWRARHGRRRRAECVAASEFARELADAIDAQATDEFRAKYRRAALLIVEDLGQLSGRTAAQVELMHTVDAVLAEGGRVIVTAAAPIAELPELAPPLAGRLSAGLSVRLRPPSAAVRAAVLREFAARRGVPISNELLDLLAAELELTVPELLGALVQLAVAAEVDSRRLDASAVREFIGRRNGQRRPPLREIAAVVAKQFGLRLGDLRGPSRRRSLVTARDLAIYLARTLGGESFVEIGRFFGGRDHTTILHGYQKITELLDNDPALRRMADELLRRWERR